MATRGALRAAHLHFTMALTSATALDHWPLALYIGRMCNPFAIRPPRHRTTAELLRQCDFARALPRQAERLVEEAERAISAERQEELEDVSG